MPTVHVWLGNKLCVIKGNDLFIFLWREVNENSLKLNSDADLGTQSEQKQGWNVPSVTKAE